jgi:hypothetical protein
MSDKSKPPFARRGLQIVPVTRVGWLLFGLYLAFVLGGTALMIALTSAGNQAAMIAWIGGIVVASMLFTVGAWRLAAPVPPPPHRDDDYWFVPKLFGFGATPITWQGWALTIGMVTLVILDARFVEPTLVKVVVEIGVIVGFIAIAAHKTAGGWRWRWGPGE